MPNKINKWDYEVCDVVKVEMSQIRGVLKKRLTRANGSTKQKPMLQLCEEDYATYDLLDEIALGNQKLLRKR